MALKESGAEPTYALVVAQCPTATLNPTTGKVVEKKRIYDVMRERCYDEDPGEPWTHRARLSKTLVTHTDAEKRCAWAQYIQALRHSASWYQRSLVWTDICNSILPRTQHMAKLQSQARKGGKGWISNGSQDVSRNLRGPKESLKQNSWDSLRVWWAPVLLRGKAHVEVLGSDFPGECEAGAAVLVQKVRAAINIRCQSTDQPKVVFVDRGKGFYNPGNGKITQKYRDALQEHGLQAFMGEDGSRQPGNLQEAMLHETLVAWVRKRLERTMPKKPWEESEEKYGQRLRQVIQEINAECDVASVCAEFCARSHRARPPCHRSSCIRREGH